MRVLILEDDQSKLDRVRGHLAQAPFGVEVHCVATLSDYIKAINQDRFDFLILDLVVPRFKQGAETVEVLEIVECTRGDYKCPNARTPGIVLTGYEEKAEEGFRILNQNDFTVITYSPDDPAWAIALDKKIRTLPSVDKYDFVVVCALDKEEYGFVEAGFDVGAPFLVSGLRCRRVSICGRIGVIVTAPRMGLVTAAITATQAIQQLQPQVICMSGICGGVPGAVSIYDVVVAETCHQHDAGKWVDGSLRPEVYSVAIDHTFAQKVRTLMHSKEFAERVTRGVSLSRSEFPDGIERLNPAFSVAPASSGSAVLGDESAVERLKEQQRKCAIFEMESYAVYEAARLSPLTPQYFSAKAVVDDGGPNKSDAFHRVGCILSARVVGELLSLHEFR